MQVTPSPTLLVFPPGVSMQTASNGELSTAVKAAIFQHPDQAPQIVSATVTELAKGGRLVPQKIPASARGATITALLVKRGQKVTTGQILAVLDVHGKRMKYSATADGTIQSLGVSSDMTQINSDSLALIAQSSESSLTAIRQVILAAAVASPDSITEIVEASAKAAPTVSSIIIRAAQEAAPAKAEAIAKAAPPVVPAHSSDAVQSKDTPAEEEIKQELATLKAEGKLGDKAEVSAAVQKVMKKHTETKEISAPLGAKVIAIHKHAGEVVHKGDKILTLRLANGSNLPILAVADGVMQELSVSKGGVIGNTRPKSAKAGSHPTSRSGVILITMITG
jgi:acetyl/propionyl-CoA carboxylase alpha subunit